MLNSVGENKTSLSNSYRFPEPVSSASIEEYCACGYVIQVFNYGDEVGADVVFAHGGPKCRVPDHVESLFGAYKDMV